VRGADAGSARIEWITGATRHSERGCVADLARPDGSGHLETGSKPSGRPVVPACGRRRAGRAPPTGPRERELRMRLAGRIVDSRPLDGDRGRPLPSFLNRVTWFVSRTRRKKASDHERREAHVHRSWHRSPDRSDHHSADLGLLGREGRLCFPQPAFDLCKLWNSQALFPQIARRAFPFIWVML
jgi:hypothetical protein